MHATRSRHPLPWRWRRSGSLRVMPDQTLISTLRGQLEDERARLTGQIAALGVGSDDAPSYDENFADSGQVCGRPISDARLEAMPATRFCIDHA
jgi:hypothetical protein